MTHLHYPSDRLINGKLHPYVIEMPKEPKWHDMTSSPMGCDYEIRDEQRDEYERAVKQALSNSKPFIEDFVEILKQLVLSKQYPDNMFQANKVYSLLDVESEIQYQTSLINKDSWNNCTEQFYKNSSFYGSNKFREVAIL